jgi:arylsulfatase A-like enzyme
VHGPTKPPSGIYNPAIVGGRLLRGAAEGAALGASLGVAEIAAGYLSGGWFSARWWPVLLAFDAALGTLCGLAASWSASRAAPFAALGAVYAWAIVNHEALPGRVALGLLPVTAAVLALLSAIATAAALGRAGRRVAPLVLPWLLVAGLATAGRLAPPEGPLGVLARLGITFGFVIAAAGVLSLAARGSSARAWQHAAAGVLAAVACAYGLTGPRPGQPDFHDLPQPASGTPEMNSGVPPLARSLRDRAAGAGRGTRASVVLIVLDSVGAASLSAPLLTPRIDAFAREGIVFADALTPAPWTVPAHASLFTGLTPSRHGAGEEAGGGWAPLDSGALTLAEILAAEGYATAGLSANRAVSSAFGLSQGFRYFESLPPRDQGFVREPLLRRLEGHPAMGPLREPLARAFPRVARRAPEISERAARWLRRGHRPYFLFVNYMEAHLPHLPDYQGALASLDHHLGRLLDEVRAQPGGDEAWIVLAADHGDAPVEPGRGHGCDLRQEVLHVPLMVQPPRSRVAVRGLIDARPVMLTDVLPLLLDGLGLPAPPSLDGQLPGAPRPFRIAERAFPSNCGRPPGEDGPRWAIQDDRFKLIVGAGTTELYDRAADPAEAHNLAASHAGEAARLRASLAEWERGVAAARIRPVPQADPERAQRLRALGYLP